MKKILLTIISIITFLTTFSQRYEHYVTFEASTREVTFFKNPDIRDEISCEYSVDGRIIGVYRLDYRSTVITLPSSFSRCQYRFYYTVAGTERSGDIGIAVVDDVDMMHFEHAAAFGTYFSNICDDEYYEFFIINNIMLPSKCVCEYYSTVTSSVLLQMYVNGILGDYLQNKCEKAGWTFERAAGSRMMNMEQVKELLTENNIELIIMVDMQGHTFQISDISSMDCLSAGLYLISYNKDGFKYYEKFIME